MSERKQTRLEQLESEEIVISPELIKDYGEIKKKLQNLLFIGAPADEIERASYIIDTALKDIKIAKGIDGAVQVLRDLKANEKEKINLIPNEDGVRRLFLVLLDKTAKIKEQEIGGEVDKVEWP